MYVVRRWLKRRYAARDCKWSEMWHHAAHPEDWVTTPPSKMLLSIYHSVRCHIPKCHCQSIISMWIAFYMKHLTSTQISERIHRKPTATCCRYDNRGVQDRLWVTDRGWTAAAKSPSTSKRRVTNWDFHYLLWSTCSSKVSTEEIHILSCQMFWSST